MDIEKNNAAIDNLTDEQKAAFREAKSPEEILELAQKNGMKISIEELDAVAGGENRWNECSQDTNSGPYQGALVEEKLALSDERERASTWQNTSLAP